MIKIAVIPLAGKGTRMYPATYFIPKVLLPLGNKPTLLFLLEELDYAKIYKIYFIINKEQTNIINMLNINNIDKSNSLYQLISKFEFNYIIQNDQNGLARGLYLLKNIIKEPFALLLSDNIIIPIDKGIYTLKKLYDLINTNVVSGSKVDNDSIKKYGIININDEYEITSFVEKPIISSSNIACNGRYILNNTIFDYIEKDLNKPYELLLPNYIIKEKTLLHLCEGNWLDVGTKDDYLKANLFYNNFIKIKK